MIKSKKNQIHRFFSNTQYINQWWFLHTIKCVWMSTGTEVVPKLKCIPSTQWTLSALGRRRCRASLAIFVACTAFLFPLSTLRGEQWPVAPPHPHGPRRFYTFALSKHPQSAVQWREEHARALIMVPPVAKVLNILELSVNAIGQFWWVVVQKWDVNW